MKRVRFTERITVSFTEREKNAGVSTAAGCGGYLNGEGNEEIE